MENLTIDLKAINNIPLLLNGVLSELKELQTAFKDFTPSQDIERKFITVEQASQYLDVSRSGLYQAIHYGQIPFHKPNGKRVYFLKQDLDDWISASRTNSKSGIEKDATIRASKLSVKK